METASLLPRHSYKDMHGSLNTFEVNGVVKHSEIVVCQPLMKWEHVKHTYKTEKKNTDRVMLSYL